MKTSIGTYVLMATLFLISLTAVPAATLANDCDCPAVSCNTCQEQVNLEFYTEKCGGGKKLKSCKRPICADKDPLPEMCKASAQPVPQNEKPEVIKKETPKTVSKPVGTLVVAVGECFIHRKEEKNPAKMAMKVFEGDIIETGANGKLVVKLNNDNTMNLPPNSKAIVEVHEVSDSTHKTLINLMYGTVRSSVKKPKDAKNDFKVKTPSAVAGVRGTEFVTSYTDKVGITKVETLHGLVELSSPSGKHKVEVPKGTYASYVVPSQPASGIGDDDIERYVERGYMTEAQQLSAQDILKIEEGTAFGEKKEAVAAAKKQPICSEPQALLNQCVWMSEPSSQKCVRKRCNANGEWAEETRMPANASENCGSKPVVAPCDY